MDIKFGPGVEPGVAASRSPLGGFGPGVMSFKPTSSWSGAVVEDINEKALLQISPTEDHHDPAS